MRAIEQRLDADSDSFLSPLNKKNFSQMRLCFMRRLFRALRGFSSPSSSSFKKGGHQTNRRRLVSIFARFFGFLCLVLLFTHSKKKRDKNQQLTKTLFFAFPPQFPLLSRTLWLTTVF